MILLVVAVLLVLLVGVAVVGGATGLAGGDAGRHEEGERTGLGALAIPAVVVALVLVLLVVVVGGLGLTDVRSGRPPVEPAESVESVDEGPIALDGPSVVYDAQVTIDRGASPLRPLPVARELEADDLVEVRGAGFLGDAEGVVAQCDRPDSRRCRNVASILTDGAGRVRIPYRVEGSTSGTLLVVEVDFDRGLARLGFGPTAGALAELTIDDASLTIVGAPEGEGVEVRECAPDVAAIDECETIARPRVAADGSAVLALDARPREGAVLTLVSTGGEVLAPSVVVASRARPPATVDLAPSQLGVGFGVALVLLALAVVLIRSTDWRAPAEASTPLLDTAVWET